MKIDGKQMASDILADLKEEVKNLKSKGITPTLAVILMGDDQNSAAYVRQKEIKAKEIGAEVKIFQFDHNVSRQTIDDALHKINNDPAVHGIILQRPAPAQIEVDKLEDLIPPNKEVDGFGQESPYPVPVAEAVFRMITSVVPKEELKTKRIVVLGKGETAGMPIIKYLELAGFAPEIIDSKTQEREELLKNADVVVSAVGKGNVLKSSEVKKGAIVIGVGLTANDEGKLEGDFDDSEIEKVASYYSPTPGGVGPLNVAILMENLIHAAENQVA